MSVGVTRQELDLRSGPRFIRYSFGAADLRVLGGHIFTCLVCAPLVVSVTVAISIVSPEMTGFAVSAQSPPTVAVFILVVAETVVTGFTIRSVTTKLVTIDPNNPQAVFLVMVGIVSRPGPYLPCYLLGSILVSPIVFGLLVAPAVFA